MKIKDGFLVDVVHDDLIDGVLKIPKGCKFTKEFYFSHYDIVKEIIFPSTFISVGQGSFNSCHILEKVTFNSEVQIKTEAFQNCKMLKEINLENVLTIEKQAFSNCSSIEKVILNKITYLGDMSFANCSSLKYLEINSEMCGIEQQFLWKTDNIEYLKIVDLQNSTKPQDIPKEIATKIGWKGDLFVPPAIWLDFLIKLHVYNGGEELLGISDCFDSGLFSFKLK